VQGKVVIAAERRRRIIELIEQQNTITAKELQKKLNVSTMTVWRDLRELEEEGVLYRVRGGAVRRKIDPVVEPFFEFKQNLNHDLKSRIAQLAAEKFVSPGESIILEGGTTISEMIPFLKHTDLTIITNGLGVLNLTRKYASDATVICSGGILREPSRTFVGPQAEGFFRYINAHTFFISGTGITAKDGITDPSPLEIQVKRAMKSSAQRTVLMVDSTKFGLRSLSQIIPLTEIDHLITDAGAPRDMLDEIEQLGVKVHIAE